MGNGEELINLSKAASEFNTGISTLVEFLHRKGINLDPNPNTKISHEAYCLLMKEYNTNPNGNLASNKPEFKNTDIRLVGKIDLKKPYDANAENHLIHKQKNYGSKRFEGFKPTEAIGTLKFFDYKVNKFGIITDAKCASELRIEKVHVSKSGLATDKILYDGEIVTLTLNKGTRGYYATNVKPLIEVTLQTLSNYASLLSTDQICTIVRNSVSHNAYNTDYHNLTPEDKKVIRKITFNNKDSIIWRLLVDINDNELIDEYLISVNSLRDNEKINLIRVAYHQNLIREIFSSWTKSDKSTILNLAEGVRHKHIQEIIIPQNFIDNVKAIEWTFDEIWQIYSCFQIPELRNEVLQLFSFKNHGSVDRFRSLIPPSIMSAKDKEIIQANLAKDIAEVSAGSLIGIFVLLYEYQIINDENHLLKLLDSKNLNKSNIEVLIAVLSEDCSIDDFRRIISNSIKNIRNFDILEILDKSGDKVTITKGIIDAYCSLTESESSPDYLELLNHYRELNNLQLLNYILDYFSIRISEEHPYELLDIAMHANNIEAQKISYQKLTFKSEYEIIRFIEKIITSKILPEVKACNKPLSGFINLLQSKSKFKLTPDCQKFLQINKGKIQSYAIKFLIYQHYKGNISKSELKEILNSFQWTEISAILIIEFIQEKDYSEKFLLNKLDKVYKKHFAVINEQEFDRQSFFDNFSINNFLHKCNGRKYFDMKKWEKGGQIRWYMESNVLHESWDSYDSVDFYCEGRPWKRENLWDAQTNKPITRKIDFYWCRNKSCAGRNDTVNLNKPFNQWTLVEIAEVLKIPLEKNVLANLAGWVNRINKILNHLFCRSCGEILRPLPFNPTILGFYAVPVFNCINPSCPEHGKRIRLTHCLNGKCETHANNEPLDSRDCVSCKPSDLNHTGLKCNYCGQVCPSCAGQIPTRVQNSW